MGQSPSPNTAANVFIALQNFSGVLVGFLLYSLHVEISQGMRRIQVRVCRLAPPEPQHPSTATQNLSTFFSYLPPLPR
jgi:hypothetical protein